MDLIVMLLVILIVLALVGSLAMSPLLWVRESQLCIHPGRS